MKLINEEAYRNTTMWKEGSGFHGDKSWMWSYVLQYPVIFQADEDTYE